MSDLRSHGERLDEVGRGVTLCSEAFGDPADPPVLLTMGLGMQHIHWPDPVVEALTQHNLYVVRFDNRDRGRSTHFPDVKPPSLGQLATRRFATNQYSLWDMARDTVGLLDALELDSVHIVGASMGGMIAQTVAATAQDRVRSLVSIMSNTGSRWNGQPAPGIYPLLLGRFPRGRDAYIEHQIKVFRGIGSPGEAEDPELREIVARAYDRDHDPTATGRQLAAILAAGDRTAAVRTISAPTLVIHGEKDRLVAPSGGRATARAISNARLMMMPGMGHDLPRRLWPELTTAISDHVLAVERARTGAAAPS